MTFSGRLVWAAILPIGIDEVFEARITWAGQMASRSRKNLEFQILAFDRRFNDVIGRVHVLQVGGGPDPGQNGIPLCGIQLSLVDTAIEIFGDIGQSFGSELLLDITHQDLQPACCRHLGDAVAHLAGTDHTECLDLHSISLSF